MTNPRTSDPRMIALLDTLLPGDGADWPAAGAHGLAPAMDRMAALAPGGQEAVQAVLTALPDGFAQADADTREAVLAGIEAAEPEAFAAVITAAYNAYYTDSAVRDVIERLTGYENRPPQPQGYDLPPFDEGLLKAVKARGPIWRPIPGTAPGAGPDGSQSTGPVSEERSAQDAAHGTGPDEAPSTMPGTAPNAATDPAPEA